MGYSNNLNIKLHFDFTIFPIGKIDIEEYYNVYSEKHSSIFNNDIFISEFEEISTIINGVKGEVLFDLGCGTGHWISSYNKNISYVILIDLSEKMLKKAVEIITKTKLNYCCIKENIFSYLNKVSKPKQDCVLLLSFIISHYETCEIQNLKDLIYSKFHKKSRIIIIDSIYEESSKSIHTKEIFKTLYSSNLEENISVYKNYFTQEEILKIFDDSRFNIIHSFFGNYFFALIIEI